MRIEQLYPAIAAASLVFFLWSYGVYKFHKREEPGKESISYCLWLILYPGSILSFLWLNDGRPVSTPFQIFMTTLLGLGFGGMGVFILQKILVKQAASRTEIVINYVYAAGFVALIGMPFFFM